MMSKEIVSSCFYTKCHPLIVGKPSDTALHHAKFVPEPPNKILASTHYSLSSELQTFYIFSFLYSPMIAIWLARSMPSRNQHGIIRVFAFESLPIFTRRSSKHSHLGTSQTFVLTSIFKCISRVRMAKTIVSHSPIDQSS